MIWTLTKRICAFLVDLIFPRTCAICRMRLAEREHCVYGVCYDAPALLLFLR